MPGIDCRRARNSCIAALALVGSVQAAAFKPVPVPWPDGVTSGEPSQSRRNNYCDSLHPVRNAGDMMMALQGREVSVAFQAFQVPGVLSLVTWDNQTRVLTGGFLVEVVQEMAKRGNFSWEKSFAVIEFPPSFRELEENADWAVANYDLFADWMAWTAERVARGHRFLSPILDMSLILVVQPSEILPAWYEVFLAFLRPFSGRLWCALGLLMVVTAVVYRRLEGDDGAEFAPEALSGGGRYMQAFCLTFAAFTGAGSLAPQSLPGKLYNVCFMFCVMIFVAGYTANLASLLVVQGKMVAPVQTLNEAAARGVPVCNAWPSAMPLLQKVPGLKVEVVDNQVHALGMLRAGECAAAIARHDVYKVGRNTHVYNPECSLADVGVVLPTRNGFSSQSHIDARTTNYCTENAAQVLDAILLQMMADGWLDRLFERHMQDVQDRNCKPGWPTAPDDDDGSKPLNVMEFGGIFILFGLGTLASLIWAARGRHPQPNAGTFSHLAA